MTKMIEEIRTDGSRYVGNGRTGLVFYPDGTVVFQHGGKAEQKALTKNFLTDIPGLKGRGGKLHTLGVMDFVNPGDGFADELATFMFLAVRLEDDAKFNLCMKRLVSAVAAARRFRAGRLTTDHHKLTTGLVKLARKLGRVPIENELGRALCPKEPYSKEVARRVSKLLAQNDIDWLPTGRPGRPKKRITKTPKLPRASNARCTSIIYAPAAADRISTGDGDSRSSGVTSLLKYNRNLPIMAFWREEKRLSSLKRAYEQPS